MLDNEILFHQGDRAIKIYCYFETGEKTVTNSYDVLADTIPPEETDDEDVTEVPGLPTSVVNSTAPSPQVVLRITDSQVCDLFHFKLCCWMPPRKAMVCFRATTSPEPGLAKTCTSGSSLTATPFLTFSPGTWWHSPVSTTRPLFCLMTEAAPRTPYFQAYRKRQELLFCYLTFLKVEIIFMK